jgi:hypothetical protein
MKNNIRLLLDLVNHEKQIAKWIHVGTARAYKSLFLSSASMLSVLLGIVTVVLTSSYAWASLVTVSSGTLLAPLSIILLNKWQKGPYGLGGGKKVEVFTQLDIANAGFHEVESAIMGSPLSDLKKEELMVIALTNHSNLLQELYTKQFNLGGSTTKRPLRLKSRDPKSA